MMNPLILKNEMAWKILKIFIDAVSTTEAILALNGGRLLWFAWKYCSDIILHRPRKTRKSINQDNR
jgi:hypothetical protein